MMRNIVAVIAGYAGWTVLWLGGNTFLFREAAEVMATGERYTAVPPLLGVVILSVACSLVAGFVTAVVARNRVRGTLLVLGAFLLATGVAVQSGVWDLLPIWYHITFLALLVPMVLIGGKLAGARDAG